MLRVKPINWQIFEDLACYIVSFSHFFASCFFFFKKTCFFVVPVFLFLFSCFHVFHLLFLFSIFCFSICHFFSFLFLFSFSSSFSFYSLFDFLRPKTRKKTSKGSCCENDDFPVKIRFLASMDRKWGVTNGPFPADPNFHFLQFSFVHHSFFSFKCISLPTIVSEFYCWCFLRSRCSMEMCHDDTRLFGWVCVGTPCWERAWFNSPGWGGSSLPVKAELHQIGLLLLLWLWLLFVCWMVNFSRRVTIVRGADLSDVFVAFRR